MGMYTDFRFKAKLDEYAMHALKGGVADAHDFWGTPRGDNIVANASFRDGWCEISMELKNYDMEIEEFISWVQEHVVDTPEGDKCIGYSIYENDFKPTLYFMDGAR